MKAFLAIFDFVPSWLYAVAIGLLLLTNGISHQHVLSLKADASALEVKRLKAVVDQAAVVNKLRDELATASTAHNETQQRTADAFATKITGLDVARRAAVADALSVRNAFNQLADRDSAKARTGQPADRGDQDRLATFSRLLGEGYDLAAEGQGVIARRDAEVALLRSVIDNDRVACSK